MGDDSENSIVMGSIHYNLVKNSDAYTVTKKAKNIVVTR